MADARMRSHARRDSRMGASFVRRAISGAVAQWERARLSLGRVRVELRPLALTGKRSSLRSPDVIRRRPFGPDASIPAGAIDAAVAECIRATLRTSWATCP